VNDPTPEYAGETDSAETNAYNVDNPTGEYGWVFTGWKPVVTDTVETDNVIYVAQWKQKSAKVTYTKGDHGTFEDDVHTAKEDGTDLYVNDPTPGYAGEKDTDSTNSYNAGNPTGENGWVFTGWKPVVTDTVETDNVIYVAQWEPAPEGQEETKQPASTSTPKKPQTPATGDDTHGAVGIAVAAALLALAGVSIKRRTA
jgi:hypothetical protein